MNFMMLRYFRAVAHAEQMTKPAADLKVAQPALSRAIKRVETEVGRQLFVRRNNKLTLNYAGQVLLRTVDSILDLWDSTVEELQLQSDRSPSEIVMNVSSAGASVPTLLQSFRQVYPEVMFTIHGQHGRIWEDAVCDLFLFASAQEMHPEPAVLLCREQLYLSVSVRNPLARKSAVALENCGALPFLFPDESNDMHNIQMHYCNLAGFTPQIKLKTEKQNILLNLISLDQGVALLPSISSMDGREIVQLPVSGFPCYRYIYIMLNPRRSHNEMAVRFQQFCVDYYGNKADPSHSHGM